MHINRITHFKIMFISISIFISVFHCTLFSLERPRSVFSICCWEIKCNAMRHHRTLDLVVSLLKPLKIHGNTLQTTRGGYKVFQYGFEQETKARLLKIWPDWFTFDSFCAYNSIAVLWITQGKTTRMFSKQVILICATSDTQNSAK